MNTNARPGFGSELLALLLITGGMVIAPDPVFASGSDSSDSDSGSSDSGSSSDASSDSGSSGSTSSGSSGSDSASSGSSGSGSSGSGSLDRDRIDPDLESITVTGVVRDFHERSARNGHADFENEPMFGFGHYAGNVDLTLGEDRKPVHTGAGRKVSVQWEDALGHPICYCTYDESLGDTAGNWPIAADGGITSADTFNQWYNDVPGVNLSAMLPITLVRQGTGTFVFDDTEDPFFISRGGFFPIDDMLFGNSGGTPDHNYHFTFELHMEFTYHADDAQYFRFTGDDDVWVYVNEQLVIDLGGIHGSTDQWVLVDRLGLEEGEDYKIDFYFAERHRTQSNFRLEMNFVVRSDLQLPPVTAAFD